MVEKEVSKIEFMIAFFDCGSGSFLWFPIFFLLQKKAQAIDRASEVFGHMFFS